MQKYIHWKLATSHNLCVVEQQVLPPHRTLSLNYWHMKFENELYWLVLSECQSMKTTQ